MDPPPHVTATNVRCPRCGYNLTGVAIGAQCPECGERVVPEPARPASAYAITSMVLGILSMPSCMACGLPALILGSLAIVFWLLARREIAAGHVSPSSRGMATAGLVCGIIGLSLFFLFLFTALFDDVGIFF